MKERFIKVLKVAPFLPPKVIVLENNLMALQNAVSIGADYRGLIEVIDLDEKACIICNEESKMIGLEPNRRLGDDIAKVYGIKITTCFISLIIKIVNFIANKIIF